MSVRYLIAAAAGFTVTAALLFLMHLLVEISGVVMSKPGPRHPVAFVEPIEETPVIPEDWFTNRPADPEPPPTVRPVADAVNIGTPHGMGRQVVIEPGPGFSGLTLGVVDSALFNIISVEPHYPVAAARAGIEGVVIVQFDVSENGLVQNAAVVESSNRLFNSAAIDAMYKFRFKARTVNGTPHSTSGLRRLFRFEMERS